MVVVDTWQEVDVTPDDDEVVEAGAAVVAEDAVVADVELAVEDAARQLEEQVVAETLAETAFGTDSEVGNCTTTPTLMEFPTGNRPW